jgi:fructose-1,6-bisphosphatase I
MPYRIITIERHILEEEARHPEATGTLTNLLYDIALVAKIISREMRRAGLVDVLGLTGATNIQGEQVAKLDALAHETVVRMTGYTGRLCIMASEEHEDPIPIPDEYPCGKYVLLFDPIDGSSNIDYNVSVGTIFSIHNKISTRSPRGELKDLLQPGYKQVAAGYVVYGSSTMMVYTTGNGVHGFTLDPTVGEFLLSHPNIKMPATPKYYGVNQGYENHWREGVKRYVRWLQGNDADEPREQLSLRYTGSFAADFHRMMLAGGVYLYPPDLKSPKRPFGKLRLCYEASPLAFIAEQAGGYASDGVNAIMNITPTHLHQRVPLFIGSRDLVEKAEEYIQRHDREWVEEYQAAVSVETVPDATD